MSKNRKLFANRKKPWLVRLSGWVFSSFFTLFLITAGFAYITLTLSLPQYDGDAYAKVAQDVSITRDDLGVPTIRAQSRNDLAVALGWTHAQERFFQMDLLRRRAAGELSELFGPVTIKTDKHVRRHRFRARGQQILQSLPPAHQELLQHYAEGVNAGLAALDEKPFEYWLLNTEPASWLPEDSLLTVYAMYLSLQPSSVEREKVLQKGHTKLPPSLFNFLVPNGSDLDAPVDFSSIDLPELPDTIPESIDLSSSLTQNFLNQNLLNQSLLEQNLQFSTPELTPGSNNFAVSKEKSASGNAMIAGDMHLGLSVPNIWYKAAMEYQHQGKEVKLIGVTLPGTPLLIAGTNHKIAWAFTNSYGDYFDSIPVQLLETDPNSYIYKGQQRRFKTHQEVIRIKSGKTETLTVKETIVGPVELVENNMAWSYLWVAHEQHSINLNLQHLEQANSVAAALAVAKTTAIPAQNIVVADTAGNIGWTLLGPLPQRQTTESPFTTLAFDQGEIKWQLPEDYPELVNPESHQLWTANNRVVGNEAMAKIGNGGYVLGIRSRQIRDRLTSLNQATEQDLLEIQLDTESQIHWRWKEQLISLLRETQLRDHPLRREFRDIIANWNGKADIDQAGFTLIRAYRWQVKQKLLDPWSKVFDPKARRAFSYYSKHYEYPLWQLITHQPKNFLPADYSSYQYLLLTAVDDAIKQLTKDNTQLSEQHWGKQNQLTIQHPISRAVPLLGFFLDRPASPVPGSTHTPRAQGRSFGASQRMVIAPGNPAAGIFHMPGGQSAHPLSSYYNSGFNAWVRGEPLALMPKNKIHHLTIKPLQ